MFRKISVVFAFVFAAFSLIASPAMAAVTFDATTGTGFVGKGDVQLAFGWNNAALQTNASGVWFTYIATDSYDAVCTWTTGEGTRGEKTHNVDHTTTASVNSSIAFEARKNTQGSVNGFTLTGFGGITDSGEVPVVDGPCMGNEGHAGTWSSVTYVGSNGGLYVNYGGTSSPLHNTPVS